MAPAPDDATLGSALLDLLTAAGVEVVFGLPGVHNLPLWSAHREGHPRIIGVRHEQAAAYAADGYARATGRLGVAITTTGPGAANALAAFGEAATCGSPILVIASDVSAALRESGPGDAGTPRGILHEMNDQAAMFAAFADHGVIATTARTVDEALSAVREAIQGARRTPTAPRYLGIPSDLLSAPACASVDAALPPQPLDEPEATAVQSLTDLLETSPRVVLWAGGGIVQCGEAGEEALRDLATRLGAPVVTTYAGRGVLSDFPGIITAPVHEPEIADLIAGADLLLIIGSDADGMNTRNWRMPIPPRMAAIGLGSSLPRTFDYDVLIQADLIATIRALIDEMGSRGVEQRDAWTDARALSERVRTRLRTDDRTAAPMTVVDAVASWPTEGAVICDMAIAGYWVGGYAVQPRPRRLQYPVGWGTLGFALPAAIGPASAGIPTLAVCGDGGPMFALGELATLAQEKLPVTLLIVDDGGYGMLRFDQQVFGHPERGVDLLTPDWEALGAAFGIPVTRIDVHSLPDALAPLRPGPRILVVADRFLPPKTTSPRWFEDV
jgi:thiamine pyrophosphate-dependent acetolactate synthase large subunit-like protein